MRRSIASTACTVAVGLALSPGVPAQEFPVRVAVYAEHHGGNVVYRYEVRNNGPGELRAFYIGCDCPLREGDALAQLQTLPPGAQAGTIDTGGTHIDIPAPVTTQPSGWRVELKRPRDAPGHWLAWRMPAARTHAGIGPGQTLSGFSVVLPQADAAYLQGNYSAHVLQNGRLVTLTAPLTLLDTTPPTLSLQALPTPSSSGASRFRVRATAKDDRDPQPQVTVESLERIDSATGETRWSVQYSATDASGNRTTAHTIVTSSEPPVPAPAPAPINMPMVQARVGLPNPAVLP